MTFATTAPGPAQERDYVPAKACLLRGDPGRLWLRTTGSREHDTRQAEADLGEATIHFAGFFEAAVAFRCASSSAARSTACFWLAVRRPSSLCKNCSSIS